jgi:D-proline reductase (dithiol) PrdB
MHPSVGVEIAREGILEVLTAVALEVLVAAPDGLVSLAARYLEQNGIATVVMGCAKDIVEFVGAPRFLFSDFPLGNAAGRPKDPQSQAFTLELALRVLESAPAARTTVQSPLRWSQDPSWKLDYSNIERLSSEEIRCRREEFDRQKEIARDLRDQRGWGS